jgi:hypothetical protein
MRKIRLVVLFALAMSVLYVPGAFPLSSGCSECDIDEYGNASCESDGYQVWANCSPIVRCELDEYGHRVNCQAQCSGQRCLWT